MALLIYNTVEIVISMSGGTSVEDFIVPVLYLQVLILFIIVGHALPIIWTFSFKKYIEMLTSLLSYLYYAPTYINILQIFAFCRIDDLSWGTKGLDNNENSGIQREWEKRKYIFVLQFITTNVVLSYVLIKVSEYDYARNVLILVSTCLVAFLLGFRLIFALFYLIKYYIQKPWKIFTSYYINENRANGNRVLTALRMIQLKMK